MATRKAVPSVSLYVLYQGVKLFQLTVLTQFYDILIEKLNLTRGKNKKKVSWRCTAQIFKTDGHSDYIIIIPLKGKNSKTKSLPVILITYKYLLLEELPHQSSLFTPKQARHSLREHFTAYIQDIQQEEEDMHLLHKAAH